MSNINSTIHSILNFTNESFMDDPIAKQKHKEAKSNGRVFFDIRPVTSTDKKGNYAHNDKLQNS